MATLTDKLASTPEPEVLLPKPSLPGYIQRLGICKQARCTIIQMQMSTISAWFLEDIGWKPTKDFLKWSTELLKPGLSTILEDSTRGMKLRQSLEAKLPEMLPLAMFAAQHVYEQPDSLYLLYVYLKARLKRQEIVQVYDRWKLEDANLENQSVN